jgi:uncharacterized protein
VQHLKPNISYDRGLFRTRKIIKESNLLFLSDLAKAIEAAEKSVLYNRALLEEHIKRNPAFAYSLSPLDCEEGAARIVQLASEAAFAADVGPFAAVPGALADLAVETMESCGASTSLVENGGEIAADSKTPLNVGVYAGASPVSARIGFHLQSDDFPVGISTSSASVSHALTFGKADAAVAVADTAALSDASATAICNAVKGEDVEASVQAGLEAAKRIPNLRGALVVREGYVGSVGRLPKLLNLKGDVDGMLKASLYNFERRNLVLP